MSSTISVIIPVYNVEEYLDACVESIVNQTYDNLEIILVDDGSKDHSAEICDRWAIKDHRIKVIHKENGGASSARNRGLDEATGEFIGFVDADDYIEADMYEFLFNNLLENDADISRCAHSYHYDDGTTLVCDEVVDHLVIIDGVENIIDTIKYSGNKSVVLWNKIYKKSVIAENRFDEHLIVGEDVVFLYNIYHNAHRMVCYDIPKYYYGSHENQSFSRKDYNYQAYLSMKKIVEDQSCPVSLYYKYYTFAIMTIHDIIINDFDADYMSVRNDIVSHRKKIFNALLSRKEKMGIYKLVLICLSSKLYCALLKKKH